MIMHRDRLPPGRGRLPKRSDFVKLAEDGLRGYADHMQTSEFATGDARMPPWAQ